MLKLHGKAVAESWCVLFLLPIFGHSAFCTKTAVTCVRPAEALLRAELLSSVVWLAVFSQGSAWQKDGYHPRRL